MVAKPGTYDPIFVQGDDWSFDATFNDAAGDPIDMSAYSFLAQARTGPTATVAWAFAVDTTQAAAGILTLTVADTVTVDVGPGRYVWDLQWTDDGGLIRTILAGTVEVLAEVSRP